MNKQYYTGIANDDRRIQHELQAMGAFDNNSAAQSSSKEGWMTSIAEFVTWMRWKGEVGVYGCRVGAASARRQEALNYNGMMPRRRATSS